MLEMIIEKHYRGEYWEVVPDHLDHKNLKVGHEQHINVSYDVMDASGEDVDHFVTRFTLRRMADRSYQFRCPGCDYFAGELFFCEGTGNRWLCNNCFSPIFVKLPFDL